MNAPKFVAVASAVAAILLIALPSGTAQARSLPLPVTYQVKTSQDVVFITIDDGIVTPKAALDYVEKHRLPITSFLTSSQVTSSKAKYFARMSQWGSIQNHTTTHGNFADPSTDLHRQICPVQRDYRERFGTKPWMLRPPYGEGARSERVHQVAARCGITDIVMWDALVDGGPLQTADGGPLKPGSIILLHYAATLEHDLRVAVKAARAQGLVPADLADYLTPRSSR